MTFPKFHNLFAVELLRNAFSQILCAALCASVLCATILADNDPPTPTGTVISNQANATYQDDSGATYATASSIVQVSVISVSAITVSPDETAPSESVRANERVTRAFRICNTGNITDSYLLTRLEATAPATIAEIYFDTDNSGNLSNADELVRLNETASPQIAAGSCLNVLAVVDTNALQNNSQLVLRLTARSTIARSNNSFPQDEGTIINLVGNGGTLTATGNPSLPPQKLVESSLRTAGVNGQALHYTITFSNSSSTTARNVRVIDELPAGLEYVSGTLQLNNRPLTDAADLDEGTATLQRIEIMLGELAPKANVEIKLQARLDSSDTSGTGVVNRVKISADNIPAISSTDAVAVINPVGVIYAGHSNGAERVGGAQITIATDEAGTAALALPTGDGFAPNAANKNSFTTDSTGSFGFALAQNQIGTAANPARYFVTVTAKNYRSRLFELTIRPAAQNGLFEVTTRALDGQATAVANGFALTSETVQLKNLAALAFNVPLFELTALETTKTADKQSAEIGEIVTYRVTVRNTTALTMRDIAVRDDLPASFVYAEGTTRIETNGAGGAARSAEPEVRGNTLAFTIGELRSGASAVIAYRVRVGANAGEGEQINSAVATGLYLNGERFTTAPARASVRVRGGIFSLQQIVVGRVFEDRNRNGRFDTGERPVAGARIYQNNGQSVITDSAGQYNIPAVSEGTTVLTLDPIAMPAGYLLTDDNGRTSSRSWTRLLRTPLGGGALLRQNFAIVPANEKFLVPAEVPIIMAQNDANALGVASNSTGQTILQNYANSGLNRQAEQTASSLITTTAFNNDSRNSSTVRKTNVLATNKADDRTKTYEYETAETIKAVEPGDILILSPQANEVIMSPALDLAARVAENWTVEAKINGERITSETIGEARVDHRNKIATFSFVGINLRPGLNRLSLTAIGKNGERGRTSEINIWGRGAAVRLELVPERTEVQNGGRDAVAVRVRAFDQWDHPAADGQVTIETSAGRLATPAKTAAAAQEKTLRKTEPDSQNSNKVELLLQRQQTLSLENGETIVRLSGDSTAESAELRVVSGQQESRLRIRFTPEIRPTLLVGLAELSIGRAAPEIAARGDADNWRGRLAFFYRGTIFKTQNLLTLAYDSNKSLNRTTGRDRLFGLDPLDRTYPIFGDSSVRFEDAMSNSKLYARIDRGRSFAMFGDMEADMERLSLAGYSRRLTGAKIHLENKAGDFVTVTSARPDTAFARDVVPGGSLSLVRLSQANILIGSEVVTLEVRDRRNPEVVLEREKLVRSVDYNINTLTGEIFFLRPISTFDRVLNLVQVVVTYEYRGANSSYNVYTGRASHRFSNLNLRIGASYVNQNQGEIGAFQLGGFEGEQTLPGKGRLTFEAAFSQGRFAANASVFDFNDANSVSDAATSINLDGSREHNGTAFRVSLDQPLPFFESRVRADFHRSSADFYNPFGATVAPGSQRFGAALDLRLNSRRTLTFGAADERNHTQNVSNSRFTASVLWSEQWRDNVRTSLGFDHRQFNDNASELQRSIDSNLVTAGVEYRPLEKLEISVKREQNLTDADPTYPNQTTLAARYDLRADTRVFLTQRLASAPIVPIADVSGTGFAATGSRRETAIGVETKINRFSALNGRYQLENGINGTDSFAVIGLQNRIPIDKELALEIGYERGFHLAGNGTSFNNLTFGGSWTPSTSFRSSARYELRDRNGFGQLFTIGAAGRLNRDVTTMARAQWARTDFNDRESFSTNITGALAYRPLESDRYALLFSYNRRALAQENGRAEAETNGLQQFLMRDRSDTLSTDGLWAASKNLEIYGRYALSFNANGNKTDAYASALTHLAQFRGQQHFGRYFDMAGEMRWLAQPASATYRRSLGTELGFWAIPDLRFGLGYNLTRASQQTDFLANGARPFRGGFYFTITTKLSNMFDLFGTSDKGLAASTNKSNEQNKTQNNQ